jgi:hypothetical protein
MTEAPTFQCRLHFSRRRAGQKVIKAGAPAPPLPAGRVPLVSRLLALAIRYEGLVEEGEMPDYAEIARLGHVSRARLSQIMNLRLLAPRYSGRNPLSAPLRARRRANPGTGSAAAHLGLELAKATANVAATKIREAFARVAKIFSGFCHLAF